MGRVLMEKQIYKILGDRCGEDYRLIPAIRIQTYFDKNEDCCPEDVVECNTVRILMCAGPGGSDCSLETDNLANSTRPHNTWWTSVQWSEDEIRRAYFNEEGMTTIMNKDPDDSDVYYIILTRNERTVQDFLIDKEVKQLAAQIQSGEYGMGDNASGKFKAGGVRATNMALAFKEQMIHKLLPYFGLLCKDQDYNGLRDELDPMEVADGFVEESAISFIAYGSGREYGF